MKNKIFLLLIALSLLLTAGFHYKLKRWPGREEINKVTTPQRKPREWLGRYPPDFGIDRLDGGRFELRDSIGKTAMVLNFFATWCRPCAIEMPELSRYYDKHKNDHLLMLGISSNCSKELMRAFIRDLKISFPIAIDETGQVGDLFNVTSYPTTVFIGTDGKIRLYESGMIANAEVSFGKHYGASVKTLEDGKGISQSGYLDSLFSQPKGIVGVEDAISVTEEARAFAAKMVCPHCGNPVSECASRSSVRIRIGLSQMDLAGKTDEQILREIFLRKNESD